MRKKLRNKISVNSRWFHSGWLTGHGLWTFVIVLLVFACSSKETSIGETYTCPMHPTVISDKPGTCPVCGMDLVRKAREGEEVVITKELNRLTKSPNEVITASINTIRGEYKSIPVTKELLGIVTYDTRSIYVIPTRMAGRLEKVYLKYNFQPVTKGMKIAEVYSPELISAQRELVYLIQNDTGNKLLIDGAKDRLRFLGATEKQVADLMNNQKVNNTFPIYSPYDGYVVMDQAPGANQNSNRVMDLPREGSYVSTGQTLFKVASSNSIWIEFRIPASDGISVHKGDMIKLLSEDVDEVMVDFIEPFTERNQDFVMIHSHLDSKHFLIGDLVKGTIRFATKNLWLPKSSILDKGMEQIVFVREQGLFVPRKIEIGLQTDNSTEIINGLTTADEVAINAHYLVDSEGFIKVTK